MTNLLFTIIPVKPFEESKTRLASFLTPEKRASLSRTLLQRTIKIAQAIGPVVVISRSHIVRETAKRHKAWSLIENESNLNAAAIQALRWTAAQGARAALILPNDLPFLTKTDLFHLASIGLENSPTVAIVPCRNGNGTNALLLNPPTTIVPRFGRESFAAHQLAARTADIIPTIVHLPRLELDLDTPDDWQDALQYEFVRQSELR